MNMSRLPTLNKKAISFVMGLMVILLPYQNCGEGFETTNGTLESQGTASNGSSGPEINPPDGGSNPPPDPTTPDPEPGPAPDPVDPTPPPPGPNPPAPPGRLFPESMQFSFRRADPIQFTLTPSSPFSANINTQLTAVTIVSDEAWRIREYFSGQLNEGMSIPFSVRSGDATLTISLPSNRRVALTKRSILRLSTGPATHQLPQTIDIVLEPRDNDVIENVYLTLNRQFRTVGRTYGKQLLVRTGTNAANWTTSASLPQDVSVIANESNFDQFGSAFMVHQLNNQQTLSFVNQSTIGPASITVPIPVAPGRGRIVTTSNGYLTGFAGLTEERDGAYVVLPQSNTNVDSHYLPPVYVPSPVGRLKKVVVEPGFESLPRLFFLTTTNRLHEYRVNSLTPEVSLTFLREYSEHGPVLDISAPIGNMIIYFTADKMARATGFAGVINFSSKRAEFVRLILRSFRMHFIFSDGSVEQFILMGWQPGTWIPTRANSNCIAPEHAPCYSGSFRNPEAIIDPAQGWGVPVYLQDSQTFISPTFTDFRP